MHATGLFFGSSSLLLGNVLSYLPLESLSSSNFTSTLWQCLYYSTLQYTTMVHTKARSPNDGLLGCPQRNLAPTLRQAYVSRSLGLLEVKMEAYTLEPAFGSAAGFSFFCASSPSPACNRHGHAHTAGVGAHDIERYSLQKLAETC